MMTARNYKLLIVFIALSLSGCAKVFNQAKLAEADRFCSTRGGIYSLTVFDAASISFYAYCKNGERSLLK